MRTKTGNNAGRIQIVVALIGALAIIIVGWWQHVRPHPSPDEKYIGRVIDMTSQKPIAGAKISLDGQGIPPILYTDSEGVFSFPLKDVGNNVHIRVEIKDYKPFDRRTNPTAKTEPEDIRLEPSELLLISSPIIKKFDVKPGEAGKINLSIEFKVTPLQPQQQLFVEVAGEQSFLKLLRQRFSIDNPNEGTLVMAVPISKTTKYWGRLVIISSDGQIIAKSDAFEFSAPRS